MDNNESQFQKDLELLYDYYLLANDAWGEYIRGLYLMAMKYEPFMRSDIFHDSLVEEVALQAENIRDNSEIKEVEETRKVKKIIWGKK